MASQLEAFFISYVAQTFEMENLFFTGQELVRNTPL